MDSYKHKRKFIQHISFTPKGMKLSTGCGGNSKTEVIEFSAFACNSINSPLLFLRTFSTSLKDLSYQASGGVTIKGDKTHTEETQQDSSSTDTDKKDSEICGCIGAPG